MNQTVTLLLFFSATPAERSALATFQTREKLALVAPVAGAPTSTATEGRYSEDVALGLEAALDEAQTLAASLDETRALELLAEVERTLLGHAELPQAAWLMAERHELAAAIRRRQPDGAADADALEASARALEGPRARPFEEGERAESPGVATSSVLFGIRDLDAADVLSLDGRVAPNPSSVLPGRHHARVLRGSRLVWSGWIDVPKEPRARRALGVPARAPCGAEDLFDVDAGTRTPLVMPGVHCQRWVGVRRGASGLEVAWCSGSRCTAYGPLLAEQKERERVASLPPWIAGAIVGAASAGAAALLFATGAFERDEPPPVFRPVYFGP
jgi:hypothetical protein